MLVINIMACSLLCD